jgi:8-oxo-dGTP pyrophosphatase MutT (NUDIX family)
MSENKHRNDIYGELGGDSGAPAIPAATVVLVRENPSIEVLMLQKNTNISFGGMWVFPGGRVEDADREIAEDEVAAAKRAAARETQEETGLQLTEDDFIWFAHWTPPASTPKRYATWFFVARLDDDDEILVDGEEILNHQWIAPGDAHAHHGAGKIDLAPPTWITLYQLSQFDKLDELLAFLDQEPEKYYETRIVQNEAGERIALWHGDSGYESLDAEAAGPRHRLVLRPDGFAFENTVATYS